MRMTIGISIRITISTIRPKVIRGYINDTTIDKNGNKTTRATTTTE